MPTSSHFADRKWLLAIGLAGSAAAISYMAWIISRNQTVSKRCEKVLRQLIDNQLCFGRPNVKVHVISNLSEWEKVERQFLEEVDFSRMMGLDCEWVNNNDWAGKVIFKKKTENTC